MRRSYVKPITALLALLGSASGYRAGAAIYQESGGVVVVEAEHFDKRVADPADSTHTWTIIPDEAAPTGNGPDRNARGGKYIQSLPDAGQNKNSDASVVGTEPYVDYKVFIKTPGTYRLFLRFGGFDGSSDSIYAQILELKKSSGGPGPDWYRFIGQVNPSDDTSVVDFDLVKDSTTGGAAKGWNGDGEPQGVDGGGNEVAANYVIANPGVYTLRISQREDGSAVDAILLQLSNLAEPTTPGPAESAVASTYIAFTTQPTDAAVTAGTSATFKVAASGSGAVTYQWQKAAPGSSTFTDIGGATGATYTTGNLAQSDEGTQYRVNVSVPGLTLPSATAKVILDQTPPSVIGAFGSIDSKGVTIRFSEPVSQSTAETLANYSASGGLTISSAKLQANGTDVILTTSAATANTPYTITISGVKDLAGNAASNLTAKFTGATRTTGGLRTDLWFNIPGTSVDALTSDPRFPNTPDRTVLWGNFGPFASGNNYGDNFGAQISGWVVPPVTGDYKFYLRSDDAGQLYLSTTDQPSGESLIAEQTGCCNAFTDQEGTLSSTPVHLEANKSYWVRALLKEGGGDDYLQVGWRTPNDKDLNSPPSGPIGGAFLQTIADPSGSVVFTQQPTNLTVAAATPASFSIGFSALNAFGTNAFVRWQRAPAGSTTFTDISGATSPTLRIPFAAPTDANAQFRAIVASGNSSSTSSVATLTVSADTTAPTVTSVSGTGSSVLVSFSEPIDPTAAANKANYTINGGATVSGATVISSPGAATVVRLDLAGGKAGTSYNLGISGVKDLSNNALAATTRSFIAFNIFADFNGGQAPAGASLNGTVEVIPSGSYDGSAFLQLTPPAGSSQGTIVFPNTDTASVSKLTALWKMFIGNGSGNAADGVALVIASDIDDSSNFGEEGTGTGLIISFDTYDNGGGEAPAISVKYGGVSEDQIDAGGNQVIKSNVTKAVLVNNQWVDVNVQVTADGKITVIHNNVKYFDNVPIPGWTPLSNPRVAIGGRTGGEFERAAIDDFAVLFNADYALAQPPTISITSPADQATFAKGATVPITVNAAAPGGSITKVEFFANGQSIGSSSTAPYSFAVPNAPEGAYTVVAKITDARGVTVSSAPIKVIVGNPKKIYFVTADPGPLTFPGDQAIYDHLSNRGFNVITARGSDVPDDGSTAVGTDLIIESSSLGSGTVENPDPSGGPNIGKFKTLAIPAIDWEASSLDAWGFQDANGNPGTFTGSQVNIVDPASPLAAGLPAGNVTVVTSDQTFSEANAPVGTAPAPHIVAVNPSDDTQKLIFWYDKGEKGYGDFVMPAKRIFFFFQDNTAAAANDNGWKLFDAAVDFALGTTSNGGNGGTPPTASVTVNGNSLTINSSNGGTVQTTDSLSPINWHDLGAAPQTIQTNGKQGFFRIKK